MTKYRSNPISVHPKGYPIFLTPEEIEKCDEYKETDPYNTAINLGNEFHHRRIKCTIELVNQAVEKLNNAAKVLDIACGQGFITSEISAAFPPLEVSGIDYSISAIEYAVDHFSGIDFAVGNAMECPYLEEYFDIVVCNNFWEHVPDPLRLLAEIKRVLRKDGFLIISTPSRYHMTNLVRVLLGKPVVLMSKHHVTEYTVGQVLEQLSFGGFKIIKLHSGYISKRNFKHKLANKVLSAIVSITGSHHQLESTAFYLFQRREIY